MKLPTRALHLIELLQTIERRLGGDNAECDSAVEEPDRYASRRIVPLRTDARGSTSRRVRSRSPGHHVSTGRAILLLLALLLLSACATRVHQPITEEQRDRSGRYDGKWKVTRLDAPRVQQLGRERFRCPTEGFSFSVYVHNGLMQISRYGALHETYVASNGRFRLTIPTQGQYRRSMGASDNKSEITIVLQGSLAEDERSGWYTLGSARLNNHGCEAKATFEPLQSTSSIHMYRGLKVDISSVEFPR